MFRGMSPTFGPSHFSSGHPPITPPFSARSDPLDDIYGSAPSSPILSSNEPPLRAHLHGNDHEILSDLPSRQRALDTDAYREGLSNSKGEFVQEGFDEGYALGANLGQCVGYILGVLQGFMVALKGHEGHHYQEMVELWDTAQKELVIEELLGQDWVDEEGIWKWEVKGKEEEVTFREVAKQHPTVKRWMEIVNETARSLNIDLNALEGAEGAEANEQS